MEDRAYFQTGQTIGGLAGYSPNAAIDKLVSAKSQSAAQKNAVSGTLSRLDSQLSFLRDICVRLDRIADAVGGGSPISNAIAGVPPGEPGRPPYLVGSLEYINSQIGDRIGEMGQSLDRIESALG